MTYWFFKTEVAYSSSVVEKYQFHPILAVLLDCKYPK